MYENVPQIDNHETLKRFLARLCLVIGWVLCVGAILVGFFMTVMFSLSWGQVKSLGWLKAFFVSIFEVLNTMKAKGSL